MFPQFQDRADAGRQLAERLLAYEHDPAAIVLGLPRGGVVVAYQVAKRLGLPLDVFVVRKLGVPGQSELAMGAIASGGAQVLNEEVIEQFEISLQTIERVAAAERKELERREAAYRVAGRKRDLHDQTVIVVDDGLATGSTMRAAVGALRQSGVARLVVAVPVGASQTCVRLAREVDELICLYQPGRFDAVGSWYDDFRQTTDEEVRQLLNRAEG